MENKKSNQWAVIINRSLDGTEMFRLLQQNNLKVRVSSSTLANTVIFPLSSVAYMVLHLKQLADQKTCYTQQVHDSIQKFVDVHARCYVLVIAPQFGEKEFQIYSGIQTRFIRTSLQMLPAHNNIEAVESMMTTAKVLCKPECDLMRQRLDSIVKYHLSCDVMASILQYIGLDHHQIQVVQDSIGSLACLATADREDLLNCSLDTSTVAKILSYFGNENT